MKRMQGCGCGRLVLVAVAVVVAAGVAYGASSKPPKKLIVGAHGDTIAECLAAAGNGTTVVVPAGTYVETGLVVPRGANLTGTDKAKCRIVSPTDHTSTITLAGNNRVADLTVAAYPGTSVVGGASAAIDLANARTPIYLENLNIECGTDGIYTQYGDEVTGDGAIVVSGCGFSRPEWDVIRIDIAAGYRPTITVENCTVAGEGASFDAVIQCLLAGATLNVRNNAVDVTTHQVAGATPKVSSCFIRAKSQGLGERGTIYSSGNRVRLVATADRPLAFAEYVFSPSPQYMDNFGSTDDSVDLTGGAGGLAFLGVRFSGTVPTAPNSEFGVVTVADPRLLSANTPVFVHRYDNFPEVFSPVSIRGSDVLPFEVTAARFADLNWTDSGDHQTGTLSKIPYEPFQAYALRTGDKVAIANTDGSVILAAPQIATIAARRADGSSLSISLDAGAVSAGSLTNQCDGHIMTRDIDCGRGNLASMTIDEDCTVHISGAQYVGQPMTILATCDGTARTLTYGSGMIMTGGLSTSMAPFTTTVVELASDGTNFHEVGRQENR